MHASHTLRCFTIEKEPTSIRPGSTVAPAPGSVAATTHEVADADKKDAPPSSKVQKLDDQSTVKSTPSAAQTSNVPVAGATAGTNTSSDRMAKRVNPHKYLLHRPSLSQLMVYISTAFKVKSVTCGGRARMLDESMPTNQSFFHLGYQ
jgi:hypothetical protein